MTIWQFIIVAYSTFSFGISLYKDFTKDGKVNSAGVVASILIYAVTLFVLYKANVLIIN